MKASIAAVALFAGAALAGYQPSGPPPAVETDYTTEVVTITSCGPEVVSCPAKTYTTSYTSVPVAAPTYTPAANTTTYIPIAPIATSTGCPAPVTVTVSVCPAAPTTTLAPVLPVQPTYPVLPVSSGIPAPPKNSSTPVSPASPPAFTGAASSFGASIVAAGFVAIGAVVFA